MFEPSPMSEWDDLDIYDREAAEIRRSLHKINISQWVKDLSTLDPKLFEQISKEIDSIKSVTKYHQPR